MEEARIYKGPDMKELLSLKSLRPTVTFRAHNPQPRGMPTLHVGPGLVTLMAELGWMRMRLRLQCGVVCFVVTCRSCYITVYISV